MDRIQLACISLFASAAVLLALVFVLAQDRLPQAQAEVVASRDDYTMATARTRLTEDSLYLVDNVTGTLIIYDTVIAGANSRVDPVYVENLNRLFAGTGTGGRTRGRMQR